MLSHPKGGNPTLAAPEPATAAFVVRTSQCHVTVSHRHASQLNGGTQGAITSLEVEKDAPRKFGLIENLLQ